MLKVCNLHCKGIKESQDLAYSAYVYACLRPEAEVVLIGVVIHNTCTVTRQQVVPLPYTFRRLPPRDVMWCKSRTTIVNITLYGLSPSFIQHLTVSNISMSQEIIDSHFLSIPGVHIDSKTEMYKNYNRFLCSNYQTVD